MTQDIVDTWLPLDLVQVAAAYATDYGISLDGFKRFLKAYESAKGDPNQIKDELLDRRDELVREHAGKVYGRPLFYKGNPSKHHLRLILLGASPDPVAVDQWSQGYLNSRKARWRQKYKNPFTRLAQGAA